MSLCLGFIKPGHHYALPLQTLMSLKQKCITEHGAKVFNWFCTIYKTFIRKTFCLGFNCLHLEARSAVASLPKIGFLSLSVFISKNIAQNQAVSGQSITITLGVANTNATGQLSDLASQIPRCLTPRFAQGWPTCACFDFVAHHFKKTVFSSFCRV